MDAVLLMVPTSEEKEFCHFCFGATNLQLVFPLVRPDLLTTIDNIIGISIAPEAHETFSLCGECIATMDMFIEFRSKCRMYYEKLRETKIMNQAVKRMFPMLRDNTNRSSPIGTSVANELNTNINTGGANPNISLVETTPKNTQAGGDDCDASARRESCTQITLDLDLDSSAKKARIQHGANHKIRYHHIREIMNRFRAQRLQNNDPRSQSRNSPVGSMQHSIDFTNDRASVRPTTCVTPSSMVTIYHNPNLGDAQCATSSKEVAAGHQPNTGDVALNGPCKSSNKVVAIEHWMNSSDVVLNGKEKALNRPPKASYKVETIGNSGNVPLNVSCVTLTTGHHTNSGDAPLNVLNDSTSKKQTISCKPCVVVVQKFPAHQTDSCKS